MHLILPSLKLHSSDKDKWKCTFAFTAEQIHCNHIGTLHGGCTASLFDFCTACPLVYINKAGYWLFLGVSRNLNINYIRPAMCGETVLIECEIVHVGQRQCSLRGVMRRQEDGSILATCDHGKANFDPPQPKV